MKSGTPSYATAGRMQTPSEYDNASGRNGSSVYDAAGNFNSQYFFCTLSVS
jgi:hypothetical protein